MKKILGIIVLGLLLSGNVFAGTILSLPKDVVSGFKFFKSMNTYGQFKDYGFKIVDKKTNTSFFVNNEDYLTPFQEKQMSFQPDFILEYAHYLGDIFSSNKNENVQVFVDSYVALNGRLSQRYIDKTVDLYKEKESFKH